MKNQFNTRDSVWRLDINSKADQGEVSKFKRHPVWNIIQSFRKIHPTGVDNIYSHIQAKQVQ